MTREETIRKQVRKLQRFYLSLLNYAVVNGLFCLIWFVFDRHTSFWPKYVMLFWGIALVIRASRIGVGTFMYQYIPFLTSEWEQDKIETMMGEKKEKTQKKVPLKRDMKPKKASPKKVSLPKKISSPKKKSKSARK
jgi:hypothetical protein